LNFEEILKPGIENRRDDTVSVKNCAAALGSGGLDVYATPSMVTLMEGSALYAVSDILPPGWTTVGTELNVKHLSGTPLGMKVYATAELISIDGRELLYTVDAFDEAGKIGEGTHKRFIVEIEKFMAKVEAKKT
jgi:predicted thioesterase